MNKHDPIAQYFIHMVFQRRSSILEYHWADTDLRDRSYVLYCFCFNIMFITTKLCIWTEKSDQRENAKQSFLIF